MPSYYAGWVFGNAVDSIWQRLYRHAHRGRGQLSYRAAGAGTVSRHDGHAVRPNRLNVFARVKQARRDALTGQFLIDVEIRNVTTGLLVDGDFNFIALLRS